MKKIYTLLTAMAFTGLAASAGNLPEGTPFVQWGETPVNGSYVTNASSVWLEWEDELHFPAGKEIYFTLQRNDENPVKYVNEVYETYQAKITLGSPYNWPLDESSKTVVFSFNYTSVTGTYTLTIPSGILENEAGDLNQEQKITFYIVNSLISSEAIVTPPQSISYYDSENNKAVTAPFYKANALSNVTVGWDNVTLALTGLGSIKATDRDYMEVDLTDKAKIVDSNLSIDLSGLSNGEWQVTVSAGFLSGEDTQGESYTNYAINLTYIIQNESTPLNNVEMTTPSSTYARYFEKAQFSFGQPVMLKENAPAITLSNGTTSYQLNPSIYVSSGKYYLEVKMTYQIEIPGVYTLTVPAGVVTNGAYENEAFTKTFTILSYDENYLLTPENKSIVKTADLAKITITFPDATNIEAITDNWKNITLITNTGSSRDESILRLNTDVKINGKTIEITIPNVNEYYYEITIPAFDFQLSNSTTNPALYLFYTGWNGLPTATMLKEPGTRTDSNVEVEMTWGYENITATDAFRVNLTIGYYEDDVLTVPTSLLQLKHVDNPENNASTGNNALSIDLTSVFEEYFANNSGYKSFTLTIPEGIVQNAQGQVNAASQLQFTVYPLIPEEMVFEETDKEGVYVFYWNNVSWMSPLFSGNLTLTGSDIEPIIIKESNSNDLSDLKTGEFLQDYVETNDGEIKAIYVDLNYDLNGYYKLNIPSGFVWVDLGPLGIYDRVNQAMSIEIEIGDPQFSEVKNLEINPNGLLRVYNLQGVNVMNAKDSSSLKSLAPGIYIINGKKVVLGK